MAGSQRASALEDAMTVLAGAVRSHLDAEFSFTVSGHPLPEGGSELVVNVGRVHRFRVPPARETVADQARREGVSTRTIKARSRKAPGKK